jgi:drug/metabolite transporter (DMT)-like permease
MAGPAIAAGLWGGLYVVADLGTVVLPPVTLTTLRLVLGSVSLLVLARVLYPSRSFGREEYRNFAFLSLFLTVTVVAQFVGTDLTNGAQAAMLTVLSPVFAVPLAVVFTEEQFDALRIAGMGIALVGTVIVVTARYDLAALGSSSLVGAGLLLGGSAAWAGYTVFGKPVVRRYSALEAVAYSSAFAVPLAVVGSAVELSLTGVPTLTASDAVRVAGAVVYLGVFSTALAYYLWYKGLEVADSGSVVVFLFLQPLVGTVAGVLVLGVSVGAGAVVGGSLMFLGIYIVSRQGE